VDPGGRYNTCAGWAEYAETSQSIDLTRLPSVSHTSSDHATTTKKSAELGNSIEYSSREVSPPALLTQQMIQAHRIFLLHHGPSLDEIYVRLTRDRFCSTLDRFWTRFSRTWDVLLHGNPAADAFGGLKLAGGGELGFGVGEEEWGSGERDVLEDLVRRTDGLVDMVVSRFGEPAAAIASDDSLLPESEALPWMGRGSQPMASDGVIFSGVGLIGRSSLRNVSLWMRQIYTYGEHAYGVRDNPLREKRKRKWRNRHPHIPKDADRTVHASTESEDASAANLRHTVQRFQAAEQHEGTADAPIDAAMLLHDACPQMHNGTASQDHAAESAEQMPPMAAVDHPGIRHPIVIAADESLERATKRADQDAEERTRIEAGDGSSGTTLGIPDQYMKYLTLGLSEIGKTNRPKRPATLKQKTSASSEASLTLLKKRDETTSKVSKTVAQTKELEADTVDMTTLDPMPDGEDLQTKIAIQKRLENRGHFIIGFKGDLDAIPIDKDGEDELAEVTDGSLNTDPGGYRTVLRTIQVEVVRNLDNDAASDGHNDVDTLRRTWSANHSLADEAVDKMTKMRVLVYVHRPFIYCFLFENRTSSLQLRRFYCDLHRNLVPIHRPLLSSTSMEKASQRFDSSQGGAVDEDDDASVQSRGATRLPDNGGDTASKKNPIFDLIYDPKSLTVHTSIPNIPEPGTPAAEGLERSLGFPPGWNRIEALNVHSAILNTLQSVKIRPGETERMSKTTRGWWVVWMRFPPSINPLLALNIDSRREGDQECGETAAISAENVRNELHGEQGDSRESTTTLHSEMTSPRRNTSGEDLTLLAGKLDYHRMAFLVRKSSDNSSTSNKVSGSSNRAVSQGLWSSLAAFRPGGNMAEETTGGASAGWGPGALTGGIGFDARKYVEGLMKLNR